MNFLIIVFVLYGWIAFLVFLYGYKVSSKHNGQGVKTRVSREEVIASAVIGIMWPIFAYIIVTDTR